MKKITLMVMVLIVAISGTAYGIYYLSDGSYIPGGFCSYRVTNNSPKGQEIMDIVSVTKMNGLIATTSKQNNLDIFAYNQKRYPLLDVLITLVDGRIDGQSLIGSTHINELPAGNGIMEDEKHAISIPVTGPHFISGNKFSFNIQFDYSVGSSTRRLQNINVTCRGRIK